MWWGTGREENAGGFFRGGVEYEGATVHILGAKSNTRTARSKIEQENVIDAPYS